MLKARGLLSLVMTLAVLLSAPLVAAAPGSAETQLDSQGADRTSSSANHTAQITSGGAEFGMPTMMGRATLPHDLSPWGMFSAADWVVKAVMLGLLFASLVTWTIWLAKSLELSAAMRALIAPLHSLSGALVFAQALPLLRQGGGDIAALADATIDEIEHSKGLPVAGTKERIAMRLQRIEAQASRTLNRGIGVLATIGSTAPFVGLFGTVWGIMNAFIGISKAQTTNLSVVAPGIAEALLATALGLVAAIPAVMIYNVFARALAEYRGKLGDLVSEIQRVSARDLDRAAAEQ